MELREFVEEVLKDILGGVKDAQKQILRGEIVPGKDSNTDIEFEVAVVPENGKLIVVIPPAPPAPALSKVKFKIPVRLPKKRGGFLSQLTEYYLVKRRKRKAASASPQQPDAAAADEPKSVAKSAA